MKEIDIARVDIKIGPNMDAFVTSCKVCNVLECMVPSREAYAFTRDEVIEVEMNRAKFQGDGFGVIMWAGRCDTCKTIHIATQAYE